MEGPSHPREPAGRPLVGRRAALLTLTGAVDDAVSGRGALLLLAGDPGIGKTALAAATAEHAVHRGVQVLWSTCWDGGGTPGFWPWLQVLRELDGTAEEVSRLEGQQDVGRLGEDATRFRIFDSVSTVLRRAAARRPLLVVLDDLHWADASSVRLLAFLAQQLPATRLLVLGAYRDLEVTAPEHLLHQLLPAASERAKVLPLAALDVPAVAELMRRQLGRAVAPALAADVHRRTGGNPFFVEQLTQLLDRSDGPPAEDTLAAVPPVVTDVVARRLDAVPAGAVQLLGAAAVLGTEFHAGIAAAVAGLEDGAAVGHLDEAIRAGVVGTTDRGTARFEHDLFREVAYLRLPADARCRLHLAAAEELERRHRAGRLVAPQEPARHRLAALPLGNRSRAVASLVDAARDATRRGAFDEAAVHYRWAVEAPGDAPPVEPALLVEYAHALRRAGRPDDAHRTFLAAADRARLAERPRALVGAALGIHRVATRTGTSHAEVLALLEEALHEVPADEPADRALVRAALARELSDGPARDDARADALAHASVDEARAIGDASVLTAALWALTDVRWQPGTARKRLRLLDELVLVADEAGERELALEGRLSRVVALLELADPAWSTALDEFSRLAEELRVPRYRYLALSRQATRACLTGPLDRADALIARAAAYGDGVGEPDSWGVEASQWVGLAVLRGDWARIAAAAEAADRPLVPAAFATIVGAHLHLHRGETAAAAALVAALPLSVEPDYRWRTLVRTTMLAELAAAVGDRAVCASLYQLLAPFAGEIAVLGGAVFTTGPVAVQLGRLAAVLGRPDEAVLHLERAVEEAQRLGAHPHTARARRDLAAVLLARGRPDDRTRAGDLLRTAAAHAHDLAYPSLAEDARRMLAALDEPAHDVLRREGDIWTLTYAGRTARLRDAKGLHDLARLLAAPGQELAAIELLAGATRAAPGADPVLDERARHAYRRRIAELDAQLTAADAAGDAGRSTTLASERAAVLQELKRASGLSGRPRRLGDEAERARSTVTARIRDSIRRIEQLHPELGRHLRASVVTGTHCRYVPGEPVRRRVPPPTGGWHPRPHDL